MQGNIKLPDKSVCDIFKQQNRQSPQDPKLQNLLQNISHHLSDKFFCWKRSQEFIFELPHSNFDQKRQRPLIEYTPLQFVNQQLQVVPLSVAQLSTIKQDGTFLVDSKQYSIPYKWKLSEWIYKGKIQIYKSLQEDLGTCFSQIYQIKERFINTDFSIKTSIFNIAKLMSKIFNMFFGLKQVNILFRKPIQDVLEYERHKQIFQKHWPAIDKVFYQYINIPLTAKGDQFQKLNKQKYDRLAKIRNMSYKCTQTVNLIVKEILNDFDQTDEQSKIQDLFKIRKQQAINKIYKQSGIDQNVLDHISFLKDQLTIIFESNGEKIMKLSESSTMLTQQLRKQYSIRSYCNKWFNNIYQNKVKQLEEFHMKNLLAELKRKLKIPFFQNYIQFYNTYQERYKILQKQLKFQEPTKKFVHSYNIFPPYKANYDPNHFGYEYSLKKQKFMQVIADHYFWKIKLYLIRYYTWSINVIYWAYIQIKEGPLGLPVLFSCRTYYPVEIVNPITGQLGKSPYVQRHPIGVDFSKNIKSINSIRNQYQNSPDNGFFGKTSGRIFNIIYCYVYVLLIETIIFLLIIKPILICLNFIFCLFLILTAFIWMPIFLLIHYSFNLLIYQSDHLIRYQCCQKWFPLISTSITMLIQILILALNFILVFIHPLISVLFLIYALFRYVLRRTYDSLIFRIIKYCARSPVNDTWLAWKIAGPGVSRNYFQTIQERDIYILVLAELEKIQLEIYQKQINKQLNIPQEEANKALQQIKSYLKCSSNIGGTMISQSINYYSYKLRNQINQRLALYPGTPGTYVRFTQDQIDRYTENSKEIILNFNKKNPAIDLFEFFNMKRKNMDKLVISIWFRIFHTNNIFEPLDSADSRFEVIIQKRQDDEVNKMMKSLQSEVLLNMNQKKDIKKFDYKKISRQSSCLSNYYDRVPIQTILNYTLATLGRSFPNSKSQLLYSILIMINIEQIIKQDQADNENKHRV